MPKTCGIYKITSPSGKIYIGQSINIEGRLRNYEKSQAKRQPRLLRSLLKYGFENHKVEILHVCGKHELDSWEIWYIDLYDTFGTIHGLNLQAGGASGEPSKETRAKLTKAMMGNKRALGNKTWLGRKHSQETKQLMSQRATGLKKIRRVKVKHSAQTRANASIRLKGIPSATHIKTIYVKDSDGIVLRFLRVKDCSLITGVDETSLRKSIKKGIPRKGFLFSFKPFEL